MVAAPSYFADLVGQTRVKRIRFGRGGLTGVNVGGDPDISRVFKISACHTISAIVLGFIRLWKWAKAFVGFCHLGERLLFFLNGMPSLLEAATISAASFSAMDLPERLRLHPINHLMDKEIFLSGRISSRDLEVGTTDTAAFTSTPEWVAECFPAQQPFSRSASPLFQGIVGIL